MDSQLPLKSNDNSPFQEIQSHIQFFYFYIPSFRCLTLIKSVKMLEGFIVLVEQ